MGYHGRGGATLPPSAPPPTPESVNPRTPE